MNKQKFYVTTAIDYVNAEAHIGHAYQKIAADILARWNSLLGKDVFFLTGTDEHGKKIADSAEKSGKTPKKFVDEMSKKFEESWKKLNIKYDRFIRTTDPDHMQVVQVILSESRKKGDIYEGYYEGLYCTDCETYYTEKDLIDACCPIHKTKIEKLKEESYFFRLSKYQKYLLDLYKKKPEFILPKERRHEIINRVKEGLQDISISRTSFDWGIPLPFDKAHVCWVWFDALPNYLTGIGYLQNKKEFKKYWPANVHLLGKDNGWFHGVIWPAILKSIEIEIPITVFIHGFLTFNSQKISKSLGNVISPNHLVDKYGSDTLRYFLIRNIPFGEDGDFSEKALIERHNNELANKLGNLVSRVSALAEKYGIEKTNPIDIQPSLRKVTSHFTHFELDKALNAIFSFIDQCNEYIQKNKPWETQDKKILYQSSNAIKDISILLSPFIPETSEKIAGVFHFEISLASLKTPLQVNKIKKSPILFKKIEHG